MNAQPEALRLADWHKAMADEPKRNEAKRDKHRRTEAELRRLHNVVERLLRERRVNLDGGIRDTERIANLEALNAELLEALKWYVETDEVMEMEGNEFWLEGRDRARAAIAKATGGKA